VGILMAKVYGVGVEGELGMEARLAGVDGRISKHRWREGQRAEDLSVDRDGLDPIGDSHPCSCRLSSWAGYPIPKPDLIFHLEQGEEPWVEDGPHPEEGDVVTGVYTGE
jgi:hypothetical protein